MPNRALTKIFSPVQLLLGVALVACGLAFFAWFLHGRSHVARVSSILVAGVAVACGAGVIATCRVDACATCKKHFYSSTSPFPLEADGALRSALAALGRGDTSAPSALESAPVDAFRAPVASELNLSHCTQCLQVGRVRCAMRARNPQGMEQRTDWSPVVDVVGPNVKLVVDLMTRRNEAMMRLAGYSS